MIDFDQDKVSTLIGDGSQGEIIENKQNDAKDINLFTCLITQITLLGEIIEKIKTNGYEHSETQ